MLRSLLATATAFVITLPAAAQELFLLGGPQSGTASGISDDGQVVSGYDAFEHWYWTEKTGVVLIGGQVPGNGVGGQAKISGDGTRMTAGELNLDTGKVEANIYHIDAFQWQPLGSFGASCDAESSGGWNISGDGSTVVGLAWEPGCQARAFRWREATGMVNLGTLFFFKPTRANACNFDGSVIVGWNDNYTGFRQAAVWTNGGQQMLFGPDSIRLPEALCVSSDGVWIGGIGTPSLGEEAWRWSEATGYESLGPVPIPGFTGSVTGLSADGSVALCFFRVPVPPATSGEGYLWIEGEGLVPLEDYAIAQGVDVPPDVRFALPLGMSPDGRNIVGRARTKNGDQAFVLRLGPAQNVCPADLNGDGVVDAADLTILLTAWGTPDVDLDGDGTTGAGDLAILLAAWGPCP